MPERFWDRVDIRSKNECWEWTGSRNVDGRYAYFQYRGKECLVHRVAWDLSFGTGLSEDRSVISDKKLCVLHKCDNPICCNPSHLFLGTQKDNYDDMFNKGRHSHGEKASLPKRGEGNPMHKLTVEEVREIRKLRKELGLTYKKMAEMFNVAKVTIRRVVRKMTWVDV